MLSPPKQSSNWEAGSITQHEPSFGFGMNCLFCSVATGSWDIEYSWFAVINVYNELEEDENKRNVEGEILKLFGFNGKVFIVFSGKKNSTNFGV